MVNNNKKNNKILNKGNKRYKINKGNKIITKNRDNNRIKS